MNEAKKSARRQYLVAYDYSHGKGAWFNFYGTNEEFVQALAAVFQEPFVIHKMTITGPAPLEAK